MDSVTLARDFYGRYEFNRLEERTKPLAIFAGILRDNAFECASWYRAFIKKDDEQEIWSASCSVRKDKNDLVISCRCWDRSPLTFTLGQEEFLKALDRWCVLVADHPDRIVVEWDGTALTMHGQSS